MKLKNKSGLTLVEMLCCVVVMLLVSIGMVNGVSLAVRNYESSLMSSESQVLCSTLTNLVSDELRYSGAVNWEAYPIRFYSRTYGSECIFSQNDSKQVTLNEIQRDGTPAQRGYKLLPNRSYHLGMRASVTLSKAKDNIFSVTILVTDSKDRELARNVFEVEKLNQEAQINGNQSS